MFARVLLLLIAIITHRMHERGVLAVQHAHTQVVVSIILGPSEKLDSTSTLTR
jgi:hypothetical protein